MIYSAWYIKRFLIVECSHGYWLKRFNSLQSSSYHINRFLGLFKYLNFLMSLNSLYLFVSTTDRVERFVEAQFISIFLNDSSIFLISYLGFTKLSTIVCYLFFISHPIAKIFCTHHLKIIRLNPSFLYPNLLQVF